MAIEMPRSFFRRVLPLTLVAVLLLAACAEVPEEDDVAAEGETADEPEEDVDETEDDADETEPDADTGDAPPAPDGFPDRPIELTVAYPAGGGVDTAARAFAAVAEDVLGWDFTVENRTGAGGMIAHTFLAQEAQADGYTIGVLSNPFFFEDILIRDADFGPEDFEPVALLNYEPIVLVVRGDSEVGTTFDEVIDHAAENPGDVDAGVNPNNAYEFVTEFVEEEHGVEFNKVGFDGGAEGVTALLGGDIDMTATVPTEVQDQVEAGELVPIAVTSHERFDMFPDAPAYPELGIDVPPETYGATRFFAVPAGIDQEVKEYLEWGLLEAMNSPEMEEQFEGAGIPLTPQPTAETEENYENFFETLETFLIETGRI